MNTRQIILICSLLAATATAEPQARVDVVDRAIEYHGGEIYRHSETELDVCSKSGCFHVVARVDGDRWAYTVSGKSGESQLEVMSADDGLIVRRDGSEQVVEADREQRFRDWAMARVYFCFLPFRLNDPSVFKQDLGLVDWDGRRLHKVKVTFEAGTSTDAGDEYMYWLDPETARVEMFAYSYDTDGGGLRFRRAVRHRRIGGILFFDQENLGVEGPDLSVDAIDAAYVRDEMRHISTVRLERVQVRSIGTTSADLVITNGRVYTFSWGEPAPDGTPADDAPVGDAGWHPDAEAVAIRDGEILFAGSAEEVGSYIGPDTEILDVAGATVLPGLVDSHTHVAGLGELEARVNLIGVETEEDAVAQVAERAKTTPAGEWILGRGWDEGAWANRYPTLALLGERVPDHPVVLESLHGFAVWGNRLAFEAAGITRETESPDGGEILRDAGGDPSGVVLNRAGALLRSAVPEPTPEQFNGFMLAGLRQMARDGFVAVHEAGSSRRHMAALESLSAAGELPIRVYAMLSARDGDLCREWLARGPVAGIERGSQGDKLAVRSVKAYYDAALGSRGARLLADYSDRPGHRGTSGDEYGFDQELVARMMGGGFQVGIHAIGDAGNRNTLDFLERVVTETPDARRERHRVEHAQVIHPDDFGRFAELGVIASMEPPHAVEDMAWAEDRVGPERIRGAYAWRTLRQAGARLTFNSDLSGSDHSIFYGLHAAITRRDKERQPPGGWYPAQSMTPEEAVRAYTVWSAYAAHWEDRTGILAPGRWADLTIMDVDPLMLGETDPGAILDGKIVATIVAGRVVHSELPATSDNELVQGRGEGKDNWWDALPRAAWADFEPVEQSQPWFEVFRIRPGVYAIYEPGQFEEVISYLIVGSERALLFDTGLGIGDMRRLVGELTDKDVAVINSHTHYDHVGGNHAFDTIYGTGLDYTKTHERGRSHVEVAEFVGEGWIWKDTPEGFSPDTYVSEPFTVTQRVEDGLMISLGDVELEVLLTPGHAPDSLCLLDRKRRLLFTGDTFYPATLYAHLPGSTFEDYERTAARLADLAVAVDAVLPAHNEPTMPSRQLLALRDAFQAMREDGAAYVLTDGSREYDFGRFSILVSDPPPWSR